MKSHEKLRNRLVESGGEPALLAYLAGFFDGEGTVVVHINGHYNKRYRKVYKKFSLGICVANHCKTPVALFSIMFGGNVRFRIADNACRYALHLQGPKAAAALSAMYPYLSVKRKQAKVAVELQQRISNTFNRKLGISDEEKAKRHDLMMEIRRLNGRYNSRAQSHYEKTQRNRTCFN